MEAKHGAGRAVREACRDRLRQRYNRDPNTRRHHRSDATGLAFDGDVLCKRAEAPRFEAMFSKGNA